MTIKDPAEFIFGNYFKWLGFTKEEKQKKKQRKIVGKAKKKI